MGFLACDVDVRGALPPAIEWETTDCLLCGSSNHQILVESPDTVPQGTGLWFAVVQCQECGLCFTNPRPSQASIGRFYPISYRPFQPPERSENDSPAPERRKLIGSAGRGHRKALPRHGQGRLLDFGCGGGSFLARMAKQGWDVLGVDVSSRAVEQIRTQLGLPALVGSLPHQELQPCRFDVITMWESLEHVHQPLGVLREAYRLLVPGGRLMVSVPNIDSLPFRWFGHAWYGLDLPRHLTHFAPWTLQLMLQHAGFRVGRPRMVRHANWLCGSANLACQSRLKPRWRRWLANKSIARLASIYCYLRSESDCMVVTAER
jgi:2-polyprenyl-3-methyl-5-hydroxy-6-metoxy-1,4-benzoquinol methylase